MKLGWLAAMAPFLACSSTPATSGCPAGVLVVTSDEMTSSLVGVLPLDGSPAQLWPASSLGADPALSISAGRSFFINRSAPGTIYELDACGRGIAAWSARASPNETDPDPWDVAVAPDGSLWVARFNSPTILILDKNGATQTIDLSSLDPDGNPNAAAIQSVGGKMYVALDRLDDNVQETSTQPSQMAVLDVARRAIDTVIPLAGRNPFSMSADGTGTLWLAAMGNRNSAQEPDAGISVFVPGTNTSTLLLSEVALGGSVTAVAVQDGCGAAIAFTADGLNPTFVVSFDTSGKIIQPQAFGPTSDFFLSAVRWTKSGLLLVGDRQPLKGFAVHTFTRAADCSLTRQNDLILPMAPVAFGQ